MSKYAGFFAAYNASVRAGNPLTREEQINIFTNGRTSSLKDLDTVELYQLTQQLNNIAGFKPGAPDDNKQADTMRKGIISAFYKMGQTVEDAKAWAEKQGVDGVKKAFNDYTPAELFRLIRVTDKLQSDYQKAIRKSLTK